MEINSGQIIDEYKTHFKVYAGPGAGKTHWLAINIANIIKKSPCLSSTSRIACISYTNVAVEEMKKRLGKNIDNVDIMTIHSFLYNNIVKQYAFLLKDADRSQLIDIKNMDGHKEHILNHALYHEWLKDYGFGWVYATDKKMDKKVQSYVKDAQWIKSPAGDWSIISSSYLPIPKKLKDNLYDYKRKYWKMGRIHHDDVLYISDIILSTYPNLYNFLSAKYRYLFIDEFQDTNPVQTKIVEELAKKKTYVGVIGDLEQSIFSFQGACPEQFRSFSLRGQNEYTLSYNRRSTDNIILFLNKIRKDGIQQNFFRNIPGDKVSIYVGDTNSSIKKIVKQYGNSDITYMAWKNSDVLKIKNILSGNSSDVWGEFEVVDSDRYYFMKNIVISYIYAKKGDLTTALNTIKESIRKKVRLPWRKKGDVDITNIEQNAIALTILKFLLNNQELITTGSLYDVYNTLADNISAKFHGEIMLQKITSGSPREYSTKFPFKSLIDTVDMPNEIRPIRTIHKAKSDEFKICAVLLNDAHIMEKLLNSSIIDEECRIYYVACSRSMDKLIIIIPSLSGVVIGELNKIGVEIIY